MIQFLADLLKITNIWNIHDVPQNGIFLLEPFTIFFSNLRHNGMRRNVSSYIFSNRFFTCREQFLFKKTFSLDLF